MANQKLSTVSILHQIRKAHEERKRFNGVVFLILLGVFIVDVISTLAIRQSNVSLWGWIGIWVLIVAMGFMLKEYLNETNWAKTIDNFYLSKTYEYQENDKKPK